MIARLYGKIEEKLKDRVIINVHGVGYMVQVPALVLQKLPLQEEISLEIYTHVREDALLLFGFSSMREREIFELLISADGVGPKLGLAILSHMELKPLITAISASQAVTLTAIPGVGKKLAEKIIISLRDKFQKLEWIPQNESGISTKEKEKTYGISSEAWYGDLREALLNLGFKEPDIRIVLNDVLAREQLPADIASALKCCLQKLNQPRWNVMKGMA